MLEKLTINTHIYLNILNRSNKIYPSTYLIFKNQIFINILHIFLTIKLFNELFSLLENLYVHNFNLVYYFKINI